MPEIFPISRMTVHSGSTLKCHIQVSMPRQINIVKLSVPSQLLVITPWPPAASGLAEGYEAEPGAEQSARRLGSRGQG